MRGTVQLLSLDSTIWNILPKAYFNAIQQRKYIDKKAGRF